MSEMGQGTSDAVAPASVWQTRLLSRQTTSAIDLAVMVLAFGLSYLLRFDFAVPSDELRHAIYQLPLVLAVQFVALYWSGALSFVWRYVGMSEVPAFVRAGFGSGAFLLALRLFLPLSLGDLRIPIAIILMNTLSAFGGLLAIRVARRAFSEHDLSRRRAARTGGKGRSAVLLVGAGAAGRPG